MRIIYFCTSPRPNEHAGGVKVIYDHCRTMNRIGIESYVLHDKINYKYKWDPQPIKTITDKEILDCDHIIIPEIKAAGLAKILANHGIKYSIFVQNGYYLNCKDKNCTKSDIDFAYKNATLIISISQDTTELIKLNFPEMENAIINVTCSISPEIFHSNDKKENVITYMPRKNGSHAASLEQILSKKIPENWTLTPIDKMDINEVATTLRKSKIFLSLSGLEGLGLPPIEAALCGNYVIGYHGGGGREYWEPPIFEEVEVGNIAQFANKVLERIHILECNAAHINLSPAIEQLKEKFSSKNEAEKVKKLAETIELLHQTKKPFRSKLRIQRRKFDIIKYLYKIS